MNNREIVTKILGTWLLIWSIFFVGGTASCFIAGAFCDNKLYSEYYDVLISDSLIYGGSVLCIIGVLISLFIFFVYKNKYKTALVCLLILACLGCIIHLYIKIDKLNTVRYIQDFPYAKDEVCSVNTEKLRGIYKSKYNAGRGDVVTIYAETDKNKYELRDNIVDKNNFKEFNKKFQKAEYINIKYLPHSHFVISIEPVN